MKQKIVRWLADKVVRPQLKRLARKLAVAAVAALVGIGFVIDSQASESLEAVILVFAMAALDFLLTKGGGHGA